MLALCGITGGLGLYHRVRNRRVLTVVSLHRVLAETDPRWPGSDPLYTVTDRFFDQCIRFFIRHYSIVSLADVERARLDGSTLPPCPLLITFDDGWADNHQYALPILQRLHVPAAIFVAGEALGRHESFFQERMISAWRLGRLDTAQLRELWNRLPQREDEPIGVSQETLLRKLISRLQLLSPGQREELLSVLSTQLRDPERQMLSESELRRMQQSGIGIGTHGSKHEPLTRVPDVDRELLDSRAVVARAAGVQEDVIISLSFPFSKFDAFVITRARAAGYHLLFGGGLSLTPLKEKIPELIARVGITAGEIVDAHGDLRPTALAAYLFRRPHRTLESA
ncbi:MAG: polysaccharide deacetylase family protein [Pseudomonadota bacterium]